MKKTLCIFLFCFTVFNAAAQSKHSFALQADRVYTSHPREWRQTGHITHQDNPNSEVGKVGLSLSYFYKNKYSIKTQLMSIDQYANVDADAPYIHNYVSSRAAMFADLMVGYNFAQLYLQKSKPGSYLNHFGLWAWAGAGMILGNSEQMRQDYFPEQAEGGWWCIGNGEMQDYSYKIRPVAQVMLKYNPIRYAYIGVGGTFRHIASDFQPLSLNLSLGFQL